MARTCGGFRGTFGLDRDLRDTDYPYFGRAEYRPAQQERARRLCVGRAILGKHDTSQVGASGHQDWAWRVVDELLGHGSEQG